jgi:hypothetical protein
LSTGEVGFGRGFIRGTENECVVGSVLLLLFCVNAFVLQMKKKLAISSTTAEDRLVITTSWVELVATPHHHLVKSGGRSERFCQIQVNVTDYNLITFIDKKESLRPLTPLLLSRRRRSKDLQAPARTTRFLRPHVKGWSKPSHYY